MKKRIGLFFFKLLVGCTFSYGEFVQLDAGSCVGHGESWQFVRLFGLEEIVMGGRQQALAAHLCYPADYLTIPEGYVLRNVSWVVIEGRAVQIGDLVLDTTQATIDALKNSTFAIADSYGQTNSPIEWFTLDAVVDAAANSTNEVIAFQAIKDAIRLDKNTMFLKEWGVDLFNVTRPE